MSLPLGPRLRRGENDQYKEVRPENLIIHRVSSTHSSPIKNSLPRHAVLVTMLCEVLG